MTVAQTLAQVRQEAQDLERAGDTAGLARALRSLTDLHLCAGDGWQALECALVCARLMARGSDERAHVRSLAMLGLCYGLAGDYDSAERITRDAFERARRQGDDGMPWSCLAINLVFLACCAADRQQRVAQHAQARATLWRVQPFADGDPPPLQHGQQRQALWRANRAGWLLRMDRATEAEREYAWALTQAQVNRWPDVQRHAALGLGRIAWQRGDAAQAQRWFHHCIAVGDGDVYGFAAEARESLATLMAEQGDHTAARAVRRSNTLSLSRVFDQRRRLGPELASVDFDVRQLMSEGERQGLDAELGRLQRLFEAAAG